MTCSSPAACDTVVGHTFSNTTTLPLTYAGYPPVLAPPCPTPKLLEAPLTPIHLLLLLYSATPFIFSRSVFRLFYVLHVPTKNPQQKTLNKRNLINEINSRQRHLSLLFFFHRYRRYSQRNARGNNSRQRYTINDY